MKIFKYDFQKVIIRLDNLLADFIKPITLLLVANGNTKRDPRIHG